jgi:hypothetical protein
MPTCQTERLTAAIREPPAYLERSRTESGSIGTCLCVVGDLARSVEMSVVSGRSLDQRAASSILGSTRCSAVTRCGEGEVDSEPTEQAATGGDDPFLFEPVPMLSRAIARQGEMLADSCGCLCNTEQCGCSSYCFCNTGGCSCRMVLV